MGKYAYLHITIISFFKVSLKNEQLAFRLVYNLLMDRLTEEQRRKNMRAVKNKDSKIEIKLRKLLWEKGYRYRKNYKKVEGKPDIALTKYKLAIFCDSEFWHGYDWANKKKEIKSNKDFWINKIESNMARDEQVNKILKAQGWRILRFWGKEIEKDAMQCVLRIEEMVEVK